MGFSAGTSRAERKAKKRKLENSIPDVPEDLETESTHEEITSAKRKRYSHDGVHGSAKQDGEKSEHLEKSDRKVKRTKVDTTDAPSSSLQTGDQEASSLNDENAPKKSKKERKAERKAREAVAATATPETPATTTTSEQGAADKASRMESAKTNAGTSVRKKQKVPNSNPNTEGKAARFIVFIGNLPFTATTASIQKHFAAVKPLSVRHQTEKGNASKSKGYAFLEFEGYDHMKTCLKQFHQSTFKDDLSAPRKINVELTAGGGGNTKDRRAKIQEKNQKLNEQRIRQAQETDNKAKGNKNSEGSSVQVLAEDSGMHPSRRARIAG